jgi:phosphonate transport system substrate-binding protein
MGWTGSVLAAERTLRRLGLRFSSSLAQATVLAIRSPATSRCKEWRRRRDQWPSIGRRPPRISFRMATWTSPAMTGWPSTPSPEFSETSNTMQRFCRLLAILLTTLLANGTLAAEPPLKFGVGLFQPDKDRNDATYRPLANYLSARLDRPVELRTVDSWEGLAKSLANGETDMALMGPWGYVLANNEAGAQVVSTILYDGKPEYFAIMVTHPNSGIHSVADLKGRTFAFGDKGSTSGYLIPLHYFMTQGINPDTYFAKTLHTRHQAIETQVTQGLLDAGADYNRNRNAMIEQGLIKAEQSRIFWQSAPLPNDAVAVSKALYADKAFVARLQAALTDVGNALKTNPALLPPHYTGFVSRDNTFYKPIRDAGLATGKLQAK